MLLAQRVNCFIKQDSIVVVETVTILFGDLSMMMPNGVSFISQIIMCFLKKIMTINYLFWTNIVESICEYVFIS